MGLATSDGAGSMNDSDRRRMTLKTAVEPQRTQSYQSFILKKSN